jgi:hypothetical protein
VLLFVALSACAQDPWKADQIRAEAEARATELAAEQDALSEQQSRAQRAEEHRILMLHKQMEYEREKALEAERRAAWIRFYLYTSLVGVGCAVFAIFMITRVTISQFEIVAFAVAKAIAQRADIRSRRILLDPKTGTYGLLVEYLGDGNRIVTDLDTSQAWHLDRTNQTTPQQVAGAIAVKHTYILSKHAAEARKGGDATGVSIIQPPIIGERGMSVRDIVDIVDQWRKEDGDE